MNTVPDCIVVGTKNPDKAREIEAVLGKALPRVPLVLGMEWTDVEETGATLAENALLKARAVAAATGLPSLADDTGLEVGCLDGRPGVHTARFAGPDADYAANRAALLEALRGCFDRRACFRTVVALVDPAGIEIIAEGVLEGAITTGERGSGGFGYDSIFAVDGHTLAEIDEDHKNRISHRARALHELLAALGVATD